MTKEPEISNFIFSGFLLVIWNGRREGSLKKIKLETSASFVIQEKETRRMGKKKGRKPEKREDRYLKGTRKELVSGPFRPVI